MIAQYKWYRINQKLFYNLNLKSADWKRLQVITKRQKFYVLKKTFDEFMKILK